MPRTLRRLAALPLCLALAGTVCAASGAARAAPEAAPDAPAGIVGVVRSNGAGSSAPAISGEAGRSTAEIVDESALRYYAAQKQADRVKAEIRRLRRLHPGWVEPTDLDTLRPSPPEEAPLWDMFTAGRFDALTAAIAARRGADPGWQPSADLATKLGRATLRSRVKEAAAAGDWDGIVARVQGNPGALDRSEVDIVWLVAEAYARTGRTADAAGLLRGVMETSTDSGQRIATVQKALGTLPMAEVEPLLALARTAADGASELRPVRIDIARARLAALLHDEPGARIEPADLAAFGEYARRLGDPSQTSMLGWYAYKRRQFREALDWFKLAIARGGDGMVAHGLAHTLRELGQERDAEEVAFAWRALPANSILYVDLLERRLTQPAPAYIEPERIDRLARVVLATSSGEGAQALGWYAYNTCQFDSALEWFERATAWMPREPVILGHALTLARLKRARDSAVLINRYDGLFPGVVDLAFRQDQDGDPGPCAPRPTATPDARTPAPAAAAAAAPRFGRVPNPSGPPAAAAKAAPTRRIDFPIAVVSDNPLRFFPAGSPGLERPREGEYLRDPRAEPPLVARRVPGVGPMPYERLGYTLLPGWNGLDRPDAPGSAAPVGTLAQAAEAGDTRAAPGRPRGDSERFGPLGQADSLRQADGLPDGHATRQIR
ncbi:hypothetical protein OPKNFCMD_2893 [Methylobacterium crusticola]|uniref:Tetratricopeptide repeat protein n=1 Tax=Methylobacterium crusticola TaxID=1697972 RepID=A0ABQ4QYM3_9HYPH|nr:hypothetical protein [Methylobacterium crusticola]GJD50156.1 hypothetical protein OPKNFCMD_2893 [Methylobacterium crusticola]